MLFPGIDHIMLGPIILFIIMIPNIVGHSMKSQDSSPRLHQTLTIPFPYRWGR